jgi:translocation and assembly module TamB
MRRLILWLTTLALLPALAAFAIAVALRTPWVQEELRTRVATALGDALGARVSIGRLQGTLLAGVRARDVSVDYPSGARLGAEEISATYALPALLAGRVVLGTLRLRGVDVKLVHTEEGWGIPLPAAGAETEESSLTVVARRIVLEDGRVAVADMTAEPPRRVALTRVHLDGSLRVAPDGVRATIARLDAVPRGIALSPLTAHGTIAMASDGGDVRVDDLELATHRTRLTGEARIAGREVSARLRATPLSAREVRALLPGVALASDLTGTVTARGRRRHLGLRADLRTPAAGRLRLFGVVDTVASPMPWSATVRAGRLDLSGLVGTLPASRLNGRVRGDGVATGLEPPLQLRVELRPSRIAGVDVDAARANATISGDGLSARGSVAATAGRATVDGRLSWAGDRLAYQADVRSRILNLAAAAPGIPGTGTLTARVEGRGTTGAGRSATARATLRDARIADVPIDEATIQATLQGSVLRIASGTVATTGTTLTASGTMDLTASTVDATASLKADLAPLAAASGIDAGGKATAHITARGPLRSVQVDGAAVLADVRVDGRTLRRGGVELGLAGVGGDTPRGHASVDVDGLAVGGPGPWTGTLTVDWRRESGTDIADGALQAHADDGTRVATRATVRRATASGVLEAQLAELALDTPDQPAWRLAGPARITRSADGVVTAEGLELAAAQQRLHLDGRAGTTGPADLTLGWDHVDLALACRLRGVECAGRSTGSVRVTGSAAAPRLEIEARVMALTVADSPVATVALSGDYGDRRLRVHGRVSQADAGSLTLSAVVPVDLAWAGPRRDVSDVPIQVALDTDGLDLRVFHLLAPDTIRRSAGRLTAELRLTGSWPDLRADGIVRITGGQLALNATGVAWDDIELLALARGDRVIIDSLTARGGSGTLDGAGTIGLAASRATPLDLRLKFRDFLAVSQPGYEAATDGTLTIEGTLAYPVVRGDLVLTRLLVRPSVLERASGIAIEPDPTIEVVGLPEAPATATAPAVDVADNLSMDVRVRVVRDAWIRRADADVELRGELQISKAAHAPLYVTGELRLVRGWYAFQGRRFTVEESRIVFGGETPPDPLLDIMALHRVGDYEVTVSISGRATEPRLDLSSTPSLPQADILSLLVFGRPASELGREQGIDLQRKAISLASGYVAPELRKSVMETFNLDTFELSDQGVSAGRYVTRDVFVTLAQDLTGRAGQTVGVEYSITRRLKVKLSTSTQGNSAIDVLWRRRY